MTTTLHPITAANLSWTEEAERLTSQKITIRPEDWDETMLLKHAIAACVKRHGLEWEPEPWVIQAEYYYRADNSVGRMAQTICDKLAFGSPNKTREEYHEEFRTDNYTLSFYFIPERKPYCCDGWFSIAPTW